MDMTTTIILALVYLVLIALIIFLMKRNIGQTKDSARSVYDALLNPEGLERHAIEIARNHMVVKSRHSSGWLLARMDQSYKYISDVYKKLNENVNEKKSTVPVAEWLLDNFYIIEQQVKDIRQNISKKVFTGLPLLNEGTNKGLPRVYAIALELVAHTDGSFDDNTLINFVKAYQTNRLLTTEEIWALAMMIRIALVENIRRICEKIDDSQSQLLKAEKFIRLLFNKMDEKPDDIIRFLEENINNKMPLHPTYAEHLLRMLKKEGKRTILVLQYLDKVLVEQDTTVDEIIRLEHQNQAVMQVSMGNSITSFKLMSTVDWTEIFEELSQVEKILEQDPASVYINMDFDSRNRYRDMVNNLSRRFKTSETLVARKAVECANSSNNNGIREKHVGYYLIGGGKKILASELGQKAYLNNYNTLAYFGSIISVTFVIIWLMLSYARINMLTFDYTLLVIIALAIIVPAMSIAVSLVNWLATKLYPASILPKLELKDGIPDENKTIVVIPTLIPNKERIKELVHSLEVHYLANREKNLYYGIIGDFKDSGEKETAEDDVIIQVGIKGINELNKKYAIDGKDIFYYFNRHRQFNKMNDKWMGWERKRGALAEFNELLRGDKNTSFDIISGDIEQIQNIKYVITLDADTRIPKGAAKKLIGTLMHPLNCPYIDNKTGRVTEGYGLLQPRIDIDIESANRSLFSRIFAGQGGIDPYTTAVSDIYQDIFGEGIFTGKGIFDVDVYMQVLKDSIPDNSVLSHDLLEGAYFRTGLVTDIELIDGYPSRYNSSMARLHRWVRGDWQLLQWLRGRVVNRNGDKVQNPLTFVSKWKIFDNLRRSLMSPSAFLVIFLSLALLPGWSGVWLLFAILSISTYLFTTIVDAILGRNFKFFGERCHATIICGIKAVLYQAILMFVFIPHQAYVMVDAIVRTIGRLYITKRNLLQWVTAADVEIRLKNDVASFFRNMWFSVFSGGLILFISVLFSPTNWPIALTISLLWVAAPYIAYRISLVEGKERVNIKDEDMQRLRGLARKTWRYFEDFVDEADNYLPPDNYQEDPPNGIAHRTSPTNIGFLFTAILCARDLGYIGVIEMLKRLENTLSTVEKMRKWNGHLYNWYDTRTLKGLRPLYISTVDSGNFVGYLMTVKEGVLEYLYRPIIDMNNIKALNDIVSILKEEDNESVINTNALRGAIENEKFPINVMLESLNVLENAVKVARVDKDSWWKYKLEDTIKSFKGDIECMASWSKLSTKLFEFNFDFDLADQNSGNDINEKELEKILELKDVYGLLHGRISLVELSELYITVLERINQFIEKSDIEKNGDKKTSEIIKWASAFKDSVQESYKNIKALIDRHEKLVWRMNKIIDDTKFKPLFDEKRQLFSIGYNIEEDRLTKSYYDLFASEARQTSFIAIAKGEIEQKHWFRLGRNLTSIERYKGMVSWTGTMFEYFMPLLIMRNYKNTLWDETYWFVIRSQKKYGKSRHVPWGTSESGYYAFDISLNYQYRAFGVPDLGLKRGLINDMVVAPYATILALMIDPKGTMNNINKLYAEGIEGTYGFYEAIDYTLSRLPFGQKKGIVKSFMVHHQGMSLMALNNFLNRNILQDRFHADSFVKSVELLLHEKVPTKVVLTKENKEKVRPFKIISKSYEELLRVFRMPSFPVPKVHILSGNTYSLLLTDSGNGYSRSGNIYLSRWRDNEIVKSYGMFFYLRNISEGKVWSAAYAPYYSKPEKYKVTFMPHRVEFFRKDGRYDTHTEVTVSPEDDVEIRRISITNHGQIAEAIEITSYFEAVMTNLSDDRAHMAFSNLFVRTEYVEELGCLISNRRPRDEGGEEKWMIHFPLIDGNPIGNLQYETDRLKFIGRGRSLIKPIAMETDFPLSNTVGAVLDPVMSMRARVNIEAEQTAHITFITGIFESREKAIEVVKKYKNISTIVRAFELALMRSRVESGYLGLTANEKEVYEQILGHILFTTPQRREQEEYIKSNKLGQSRLWAYGISGDLPIVIVTVSKSDQIEIVKQLLKAHEYWRMKGLHIDLVILNEDEGSYTQPINELVRDIVASSHVRDMQDKPGGVFIRAGKCMPPDDKRLFFAVARLVIKGEVGTLDSQIKDIAEQNVLPEVKKWDKEPVIYKNVRTEVGQLYFDNGSGGFSEDGREYIIKLGQDQNTPAPWSNVISNHGFGFLVTESGGGFAWHKNSRENKITPWYNDPVSDPQGEMIYIRDEETGEVWTATPLPIRGREGYIIRHGQGYTSFEHKSNGFDQKLTVFVPEKESAKISILELNNTSGEKRELTLTYCIIPVLGVDEESTSEHIFTEINEGNNILFVRNGYNVDFSDMITYIDSSEAERTYTGDAYEFFGQNQGGMVPSALRREKLSNNIGAGFKPCAAIQVSVTLEPMEEREVVFLLGQTRDINEINMTCEKYRKEGEAKKALNDVKLYWEDILGTLKFKTPEVSMDFMLNRWLLYQTLACRIWARSGFYQSGGAYGFRDQLQDAMSFVYVMPQISYSQILRHASHQFVEGDVQHWWHPVENKQNESQGDKGIRTKFSDDLLWLPYVTADYIQNTGDMNILRAEAPYIQDEPLSEEQDERYSIPEKSSEKSSIYIHCIRAIEKSLKFGDHGIPLMGSGDWNDGMNTVGNKGRGESIWLGWFLYTVLKKFIPICEHMKEKDRSKRYDKISREIVESIEKNAWDGAWYLRAFFDDGTPLGSAQNTECKIDSLSQTWAVISGAGRKDRIEEALEALEHYLIKRDDGLILLLTPPFDKGNLKPGYIKGYVPGVRENGGQYTHAATWVVLAFAKLGMGDKATEMFNMINPVNHSRTSMEAARYKVEPYAVAADIYEVYPNIGRGGWTWYTGAAGWMYRVGVESILGFKKNGNKLIIQPCIPKSWQEYSISYKYVETIYEIKVVNPEGVNSGVKSLTIDGKSIREKEIKLVNDKRKHEVIVILG